MDEIQERDVHHWEKVHTDIQVCISEVSHDLFPANFAMNMIYYLPHSKYFSRSHIPQIAFYSTLTTIFGLSPLVGCLADIKFGRFKTVLATVLAVVVVVCSSIALLVARQITTGYRSPIEKATILPLIVVILVLYMVYDVNILHFSMDQLHESPADHQSLFHWFVWLQNLMIFIGQVESRIEAHILDYIPLPWHHGCSSSGLGNSRINSTLQARVVLDRCG